MALKLNTPEPVDEFSEDEELHIEKFASYYEPGVLSYETHWRLVENIKLYAEQAGIPEYFIFHSALDILGPDELKYLQDWKSLRAGGVHGGYYLGTDINYLERMYAMVGVMVRSYKQARFLTLQDLIALLNKDAAPSGKLICIPNFALDKDQGGNVASWELAKVLGWMLDCQSRGQQVVVYVESLHYIVQQYGGILEQLFDNHFTRFE